MKLWLDDNRNPTEFGYAGWVWVRTAEAAIAFLKAYTIEAASLDHDLGIKHSLGIWDTREMTGYEVVKWLEENPDRWPEKGVRVHSNNPVGRERMEKVIRRHYGKNFK